MGAGPGAAGCLDGTPAKTAPQPFPGGCAEVGGGLGGPQPPLGRTWEMELIFLLVMLRERIPPPPLKTKPVHFIVQPDVFVIGEKIVFLFDTHNFINLYHVFLFVFFLKQKAQPYICPLTHKMLQSSHWCNWRQLHLPCIKRKTLSKMLEKQALRNGCTCLISESSGIFSCFFDHGIL